MSRRRSRPRYVLAVLVLAAITLVTLDGRGGGSPVLRRVRTDFHSGLTSVQSGVHDALRPVGNFLTGAVDYSSLKSQNAQLRQEVAAARASQARSEYEQQQAGQVLREDKIPFAAQYRSVVADVVDQGSSNLEETLTIGKGTSDGVAVGQPVVTPAGLAGQVASVTSTSATVQLITDPELRFGVALPDGNVGSVQSLGPGRGLDVDVIPTAAAAVHIRKGDPLFTTYTGQIFPPGIPVGTVTAVRRSASSSTPEITVKPYASTTDLSYVSILLWSPPA
jgi:rod shape-determining protein MreC